MLAKTAVAVVMVALVQAPARVATSALFLRRMRRTMPELFDGAACKAAIAVCLDEYKREVVSRAPRVAAH